jgi:chemotaxis protein MotB
MGLARRSGGARRDISGAIWPGFVDAMTALLLVLMFVLSIFMIVQFVLRDTITTQGTQLEGLSAEVASLATALGLSRARVTGLEADLTENRALAAAQLAQITTLSRDLDARGAELAQAQARITSFEAQVTALLGERDAALARGAALSADLEAVEAARQVLISEQDALQLALANLRTELDAEAQSARLAAARADAVQAALAQTQADAAAQDATLAQLAALLAAAQDQQAAQAADLQAALSDAEREAAAAVVLRAALADAQTALSEEERRRLTDAAAAEALRARLESADTELTALTLALEAERARAEDTLTLLAAARAARDGLQADLAAQVSQAERLAALRAVAEDTLAQATAQTQQDARALELLNQQVAALRGQVGGLQDLLGDARAREAAANTQIESLGADLNLALAQLATEQKARADLEAAERERLESFASEFFGRVRQVLEGREGVQIVGDRFVFSSEVLFELGSADLAPAGQVQIGNVVAILRDVAGEIPPEIDWVLQVDGHTDNLPLGAGGVFRDNWALSQARALSVVRYLTDELGFPAFRLAAAGFGEYRPVDPANTPEARARNRRIELKLTER